MDNRKNVITLFHATSECRLESIFQDGLAQGSYVTSNVYLADYYASTIDDEGLDSVVIEFDLPDDLSLSPDYPGISEPIMGVIRNHFGLYQEEEVMDAWEASGGSGKECLSLIGSAVIDAPIPAKSLRFSEGYEREGYVIKDVVTSIELTP